MNRNRIYFIFLALISAHFFTNSSLGPFNLINIDQLTQSKTFSKQIDEEIEGLNKVKSDRKEHCGEHKVKLDRVNKAIDFLKSKAKDASEVEKEFINKSLLILNQTVQVLNDIGQACEQVIGIIDSNIKLLTDYKNDPEFSSKNLKFRHQLIYSLDDLEKATDLLFFYENKMKENDDRLRKISTDLEQRTKTLSLATQEYEDKKKEQKNLKAEEFDSSDQKLSFSQAAQILDAEKTLLKYKKDLAELKVLELEQKKQLAENEYKTNKIQLKIVEESYLRVKKDLHVDKKDLKKSEDLLKHAVASATKKQDEAKKKLDAIESLKEEETSKINKLKEDCTVSESDLGLIKDWSYQPNSIESWNCFISIGRLSNDIAYGLEISKEDILAQIDYEKAKLADLEIDSLIKNTWYKLTNAASGSLSKEEFSKEIKSYEKAKIELQNNISVTNDKQALTSNALNFNNLLSDRIKSKMKDLRAQKDGIFKEYINEYANLMAQLKQEVYEESVKRGEFISQLLELLNSINNVRKLTIKKIDSMIDELKLKSQGLKGSVLLKSLRNFVPDVRRFFGYLSNKSLAVSFSNAKAKLISFISFHFENINNFILLLLEILILLLLFFGIKFYFSHIIKFLGVISPKYGIGYNIVNFLTATASFIGKHLLFFAGWFFLLLAIRFKFIFDNYLGILFYLISIPILGFYSYLYINFLYNYNAENEYILVGNKYAKRFFKILSICLFISISLMLFREAFVLANISKSELPLMLQVLNFMVIQLGAVFLLSKEQVLNALPKYGSVWEWIYGQLNKYYYLLLLGLTILITVSNPYLGYGPQVFDVISKLGLIAILIPFFLFLHEKLKKLSVALFFQSEEDITKERFRYARTAYGIFVIVSFTLFIFLFFVLAANIWGYHIGFDKIQEWLHYEIHSYTDTETGKKISVDILDFSKVILYLLGGIIVAYLVDKFILSRIFDLLLINIGVQNAIASLIRYTIIIFSLVLGLKSVGFGSILIWILAVIGGLGVAGKELITDIIGYFIILIQRPIKIGDFIRVDNEITGIVRHITLRSVMLRRKNSVTVIVPNSQIMSRPVVNWNYSRSYFALEDILITVPYSADPEKAKMLLLGVLNNNINILKNPAPIAWLWEFTENGFQFLVRGYVGFDKVLDQWAISSEVRIEMVKVLRSNDIDIASPVRVIRMASKSEYIPEEQHPV